MRISTFHFPTGKVPGAPGAASQSIISHSEEQDGGGPLQDFRYFKVFMYSGIFRYLPQPQSS